MKIRKSALVLVAAPLFMLSLGACSHNDDSKVVDTPESGPVEVTEEVTESTQSGEVGIEESFIAYFNLEKDARAHVKADRASEEVGTLAPGRYPVVEVDGDWKGVVVQEGEIVWTDSTDGTLDLIGTDEVVTNSGEEVETETETDSK